MTVLYSGFFLLEILHQMKTIDKASFHLAFFCNSHSDRRKCWPSVLGLRGIEEDDQELEPFRRTTATTTSIYLYLATYNLRKVQAFLTQGQFDNTGWCLSGQVVGTFLCRSIVWNSSQQNSLFNIVVSSEH